MRRMVEFKDGPVTVIRWIADTIPSARSKLPLPYVISDEMPPVEQVDGRFYTSKRQFRAVGRAHGLIEVGNEKLKPKRRSTASQQIAQARRTALKIAVEKFRAGHRPGRAP